MTLQHAQLTTLIFMIAMTLVVIVYDVAIIRYFGPEASISRVCRRLGGRWPIAFLAVVFWLGVLVGHIGLPSE